MSGLSYICGYGFGSDSDDSDYGIDTTRVKSKLPVPDLSKVPVVLSDDHVDDPELHGGRTRSFPHVRGNWATFVYIKYPVEESLITLLDNLETTLSPVKETFHRCDDLHLSLSKTFVLKYHLISPFTTSIQTAVSEVESTDIAFNGIKVYCNEENTRTFIALEVDHCTNKYLQEVSKKIDQVLLDFQLPPFYEEPSYHMSIFWINGNKRDEIVDIIDDLNCVVNEWVTNTSDTIVIDKISCKSGNKQFQFSLK